MKVEFLIQPNAKKTAFVAIHDGKIKLKVGAKPIDDSANNELINFLSKRLSIPKSKIVISQGSKGRNKLIDIDSELTTNELIAELSK